LTKNEN